MGRKKKRKEKKKKEKKHGSTHHFLPRSRGGPEKDWNKGDRPIEKHQAFHTLSRCPATSDENMLPCELINKINKDWTKKSRRLKRSKLTEKQLKAWTTLFGEGALPKTAIKVIKEDWIIKDGLTFKGCFKHKACFSTNPKRICPLLEMHERGETMI